MSRTLAAAVLAVLLIPSAATGMSDVGVVAFTSDRDGNSEIYTTRIDGFGQKNLTQNPAIDQSPAFSPNGDRIAFVSDRAGRLDVWVMNADGTNAHKLTTGDASTSDADPAWSPDGTKLVFSSSRSGDGWHLFNVDVATSAISRLTSGWGVQPAWSPDGTRIAYSDGNAIKVVSADGTTDRFLTCGCLGPEGSPAWTPSGGNIVFGRYDQDWQTTNVRQLYIMSADGGNVVPITTGAYYNDHPSFSPDGSMMVFQRQGGAVGSPELYAMNLSDLTPFAAVTSPGRNFVPSWGPTYVPPPPPPPAQDTTAPTITITRPTTTGTDQIDTYTVGQLVLADYACADEAGGSGLRHCVGPVPSGQPIDTRFVGTYDFTVFAADNAGNPVYKHTSYRVVYPFSGFFAPFGTAGLIDLRPGDSIPLKFSLGADYGLDVVTSGTQQAFDCTSGALFGSAAPAGGTLTYNATQARYLYNWTSDKSSAGSCRAVTLTLRDGTAHRADFRLTK